MIRAFELHERARRDSRGIPRLGRQRQLLAGRAEVAIGRQGFTHLTAARGDSPGIKQAALSETRQNVARKCHFGDRGSKAGLFLEEKPSEIANRLGISRSRWRRGVRSNEVLVDLDVAWDAGPGIGLGWEAGIRTPIPWSRGLATDATLRAVAIFREHCARRLNSSSCAARSRIATNCLRQISCWQPSAHR
jgi:hypothetical protein